MHMDVAAAAAVAATVAATGNCKLYTVSGPQCSATEPAGRAHGGDVRPNTGPGNTGEHARLRNTMRVHCHCGVTTAHWGLRHTVVRLYGQAAAGRPAGQLRMQNGCRSVAANALKPGPQDSYTQSCTALRHAMTA